MEVTHLTNTQPYADLFRQSVLEDIPYWLERLQDPQVDLALLKQKREHILKNIQFALELVEAWHPVQALVQRFAPHMERWGYWNQWQEVLEYVLKVAYDCQDQASEVKLLVLLARLSQQQSRYQAAITNYYQVMQLAHQVGDLENLARACSNLGFLYTELGSWWRAEILGCRALSIFEQLNHQHGCAHTENHLGILYTRLHRWDQAQQHLEKACDIWQAKGDNYGLLSGLINLGGLHNDREQPDKAISYLEQALRQARLMGEEVNIGRIYINLGKAHRLAGNLTRAETCLYQAETIFRRFANPIEIARVWNELGMSLFFQGKLEEARLLLERSLETWRKLENQEEQIEILLDMIQCELTGKNWSKAKVRLTQVEQLIAQSQAESRFHHFQPRLAEYRRSLLN